MSGKKWVLTAIILVIMATYLCGCSSDDSIIGKWTVKEYELNGELVSTDDIGEYMGTDFASRNDSSLLFQKSGFVKVYLSWISEEAIVDETVNYTVTDDTIELYYDDEHLAYLEVSGDTIRAEVGSGIYIIFSKK